MSSPRPQSPPADASVAVVVEQPQQEVAADTAPAPVVAPTQSTLSRVAHALDPRKYLAAYGMGIGVNAVASFVPQVKAGLDVVEAVSPLLKEGITQVVSGSLGRSVLPQELEAQVSKPAKVVDQLAATVGMTFATVATAAALASGPAGWAAWLIAPAAQAVVTPLVAQGLDHTLGRGLDAGASVAKAGMFAVADRARQAGHALAEKVRALRAPSEEQRSLLRA